MIRSPRLRVGIAGIVACAAATLMTTPANAQGVAGASLRGTVTSDSGVPIPNARVSLKNTSTGNVFLLMTGERGEFYFNNLPVGGPYILEAAAIGLRPAAIAEIVLHLGDQLSRTLVLGDRIPHQLNDVIVRGSALRDAGAGGPAYSIPGGAIQGLPLLDRDFTRLFGMAPQATGADRISVSGQQFRFNAIQVDGGVGSDRFFAGEQPGVRGGAKSLSLEAIAEIRVLVAPFDVRQGGFAGGLINAVTRSGTNRFEGTMFVSQSGSNLTGPDSAGSRIHGVSNTQYGLSLGGPIIRDKLHFFAVADIQSQRTHFDGPAVSDPATGVSDSTARRAQAVFQSKYGFSAGGPEPPILKQPNYNLFGKISWQPSARHLIALTHTSFGGTTDIFNRASRNRNNRDGWELSNSGSFSRLNSMTTRVVALSRFGRASNELISSFGVVNLETNSRNAVPLFLVQADLPNTFLAGGSVKGAQGTETRQRAVELTDNFSWNTTSHLLTLGMQSQFLHFHDDFFLGQWGTWTFGSVSALESRDPLRYEISLPLRPGGPVSDYSAVEIAGYLQDKWTPTEHLTVTAGLRADVPYFGKPTANPALASNSALGNIDTRAIPSGNALISPRAGFSYSFGKRRDYLLRGGIGAFASRPPYAWLTPAYNSTGNDQTLLVCNPSDGVPPPVTDIAHLPSRCLSSSAVPVPTVSYLDRSFRFEQTIKSVIGVDHQIANGVTLAIDLTRTQARNTLLVTDANLKELGYDSEDRMMYGSIGGTGQIKPSRIDAGYGQVFRFLNGPPDHSVAAAVTLNKRWDSGGILELAYAWSNAEDRMSLLGNHGMLFLQNSPIDGTLNDRRLRRSARDIPHNFVLTFVAPRTVAGFTTAVFFHAHSGTPYAYVVSGDANADGTQSNDLVYIPRDASDVSLKNPTLYPALDAFIKSEECLDRQRGRVMTRNSCRNPAVQRLDSKLTRRVRFFRGESVDIFADVFNLPNMLRHNWGLERATDIREGVNLLSVSGWDAVNNRPIYAIPSSGGAAVLPARKQIVVDDSRWRLQLGARYNF